MMIPSFRLALVLGLLFFLAAHASGDSKSRSKDLPGTYYDQYNVLFGETGQLRVVEKFLEIEATDDRNLFLYSHCWRLVDGGDWNHEKGGLVVTRRGRKAIEFSVVEHEFSIDEGSTGFILGRMSHKNRLSMSYHGLGRGVVFQMEPRRVRDAVLDDESCPIKYQSEWLSQAATANGYASPFLRGDTDGLGSIFPAPRTVDITDFQNFLVGFTGSCATWECGNFNGDNVVDITDFSNHFLPSFATTGGGTYGPGQAIPEPSTVLLLGLGGALLAYIFGRESRAT